MQNVNQEIRELREEMHKLSDIVQKKMRKTEAANDAAAGDNVLHFNREELAEIARRAGKEARSFLKDKRQQAEEVYETVEKNITSHPFQSIAAAVSGGVLLGMLLRNKS